jgi:uncharacterized protein (TIGR00369 family)
MQSNEQALVLVKKVTALPGFTSAIGIEVLFATPGEVHMQLRRKVDLLQFNGFFHGGVISALADHSAGGAVTTALPAGKIAITIDLHINFLAPARGDAIVAKAKAIQVGNTVCTARVEIFGVGEGKEVLCAHAVVALRVVDMQMP